MKSKITIHTGSNYKPCIKVVEAANHYMPDSDTEDVRDRLVKGFRDQLNHLSNTATIIMEGNYEYNILPVEDEIRYFMDTILQKYVSDYSYKERLIELANYILDTIAVPVPTKES